jgi:hypothetical protein
MKTPALQRAASRKKLAKAGNALGDGSFPIPDVPYLRKAIRSVGRAPASRRPALKALIVKRARELKAASATGVKGTWAFQGSNDTEALELATMTRRLPVVRGMADVQASRSGPGAISVMHKSTGRKIGTLTAAPNGGYQGAHADGTKTPASGSVGGAMAGLIAYHNKIAKAAPATSNMGYSDAAGYANDGSALDLAGALPTYTSAATSMDGPRMTSMSAGKKPASVAAVKLSLSPAATSVYARLRKKGMKHAQALALAKRAGAMKAKATAKAA